MVTFAAAFALSSTGTRAADGEDAVTSQTAAAGSGELSTVTVTATRVAEPAFDVPAAIDSATIVPDALGVNVSESLQAVPGLVANNRQNYAQDEQISVRGFGARTTFGISGVRVYMDGMPATQPDGLGEVSQFNLATAERIEVLHGPFSALYGNSAGGVIQLFTADGNGPVQLRVGAAYGSFSERRASVQVLGSSGAIHYNVGGTIFATAGSRGHSAARRGTLQGKWGLDFGGRGRLTLLLNYFDSPDAQDPLGLTVDQFAADPHGTAPSAVQFNTRKSADQTQGGAIYDLPVGSSNAFRLMVYGGHRDVLQFQSIPVGTQRAPTSPGGVVSLGNDYGGLEPRWTWRGNLLGGAWNITAGATYDTLTERRRGYNNFIGNTLGVLGELRRDERDRVYDLDEYLQTEWQALPRWNVVLGARHSEVHFSATQLYSPPGQPYSGGMVDYAATSPVAGVMFDLSRDVHLYASYGQGFETPTFSELGYRPNGAAGLDFSLQPERTHSVEIGAKFRYGAGGEAQVALFRAESNNEITVESNTGGRSIYGNAGDTRHQGVELSFDQPLAPDWRLKVAYTYLDAHVESAYLACAGVPCPAPTVLVPSGSRIPGVAPSRLFAQLQWQPLADWYWRIEDRYAAAVYVNDLNSIYAGAYDVLDLSTSYTWHLGRQTLSGFARLDNLFDRSYAGSVIVNQSSGQYFETGPGRSFLAGLNLSL